MTDRHTTHFAGCDCYVRRADCVSRSRIQKRIDELNKECDEHWYSDKGNSLRRLRIHELESLLSEKEVDGK